MVEANNESFATVLELLADSYADTGIELLPRISDRMQWGDNRDNNTFETQHVPFDRLSVIAAVPRLMMGWDVYATQYSNWCQSGGLSGFEPAADNPIRVIWAAWDAAVDAALNEILECFVKAAIVIGIVGAKAKSAIAKNDFRNMPAELVEDDVTRGVGLGATLQMWIDH